MLKHLPQCLQPYFSLSAIRRMSTHRQHDSFTHQGDIGQQVVAIVTHLYSMASSLGCGEDIVAHLLVTKSYSIECMKWWFECMKYGADHMACPTLLR